MNNEIETYLHAIKTSYCIRYTGKAADPEVLDQMEKEFCEGLKFTDGKVYVKVMTNTSVHSFIVKQDDGQYVFTLDAFGRNIEQISFPLLPCQALELALQEQSKELENIRFRAAGILTQYKGNNYFLLERAIRVYSYGNFTN